MRLRQIYDQARGLIKRFCPDIVVLEELFVNVNVKTALAVGQAKGVLILAASELDESPCEYSPLQIKMAVTGYGRASKVQVQEMTKTILCLPRILSRTTRPMRSRWPSVTHITTATAFAPSVASWGEGQVIASVRGTLVRVDGERAVVEVGGLGLEVFASGRTLGSLVPRVGDEVNLHTYLNVREDALQLFGFREPGERTFFLWLTAVSGVGPKVALAVLSGYPLAELELAVARDDVKKFESIPGIGKKLAQRLVVELKDKVGELPPVDAGEASASVVTDGFIQARSALQNLGLTLREAEEALRGATDGASVEDLVKYALTRKAAE